MKKIALCLLIMFLFTLAYGQKIDGFLIDEHSKEPVSYAHIYSSQSKKGTLSNEKGQFELSGLSENDTLFISHTGYESYNKFLTKDCFQSGLTINLKPKEIVLDEITVFSTDVEEIVQRVMDYLRYNRINYKKGFYRQSAYMNDNATEWIEAFYDVAISANGIQEIKIDQARFARIKFNPEIIFFSHVNFSYMTVGNVLYSPISDDTFNRMMKPFGENFTHKYQFNIEQVYSEANQEFIVVKFEPKPEFAETNAIFTYGEFTFNTTTNQLIKYMAYIDHSLGAADIRGYTGTKIIEVKNPSHSFEFVFSEKSGEIDYISVNYKYDLIQNGKIIPSKVSSIFFTYEVLEKKPKNLRQPNIELESVKNFERAKYKPKFWKDNPVVKLTAEEEAIIASFERENAFGTYFK
ncbi:carboxypeptidase-like regulatory domain-containing protein [Belliella sp. DSM 107340]|uniref:Carboxypeptidase-like regulatory domain-containing protein n=1 Tax=Belliella calami TaxID=2923436 RepID=A0ABS9US34_9BACT|nr:carboxypeptidase-like regulatory domain-containing protein [Belliella calami]MCH7399025.1 carboxypeptidase-like regulatory domain-containing protein [Belliella calami]